MSTLTITDNLLHLHYAPGSDGEHDDEYIWSFPSTEHQLRLYLKTFEEFDASHFVIELVEADPQYGFIFYGKDNKAIRHYPENQNIYDLYFPDVDKVLGHNAARFFEKYRRTIIDQLAEKLVDDLNHDRITFDYLSLYIPLIFNHPKIRDRLASAYRDGKMPSKGKSEKRMRLTTEILELYYLACSDYVNEVKNLDVTCEDTVKTFDYLVPSNWTNRDEALKQTISRIDKLEFFTLHYFRNNRRDTIPK